jgi:cobalt-zinc-cadmium efflux system outer membrane protein
MKNFFAISLVLVACLAGCRSSGRDAVRLASSNRSLDSATKTEAIPDGVTPAAHEELSPPAATLAQPPSIAPVQPEVLPPAICEGLTFEGLQQMALANNPAVGQAAARIDALRGKWIQAGLPPNPSAGYAASEVGNEHHGGQQGGYAGQEYVLGGKLRLSQAVVAQEIERAEQHMYATQLRVTTDVRQACYAALIAQRRVALAEELVGLSGQAVQASQELREAEEIPMAGLLQTEVEQQNATILLQTARNDLSAAWRRLSATVGAELPEQPLNGDVTTLPDVLNWDEQLARVTAGSPELGAAMAEIMQTQVALQRARVEPIPNLLTQASVQYDDNSNDTIVGLQAGVPLPLWNRNQGGIRQAQAEIAEARRNADRVELDLKRRLAAAYQNYATARMQAETYATNILPKAQKTFDLVQRGYSLGEVGYLDLLNAQRTYSQTNLAYLDALSALWSSWSEIDGMLLTGSLAARPD